MISFGDILLLVLFGVIFLMCLSSSYQDTRLQGDDQGVSSSYFFKRGDFRNKPKFVL